jgi:hypothetical protein
MINKFREREKTVESRKQGWNEGLGLGSKTTYQSNKQIIREIITKVVSW